MKKTNDISEIIAPMFVITAELDAIISSLLRDNFNMSFADFKILRAIYMLGACNQLDIASLNHVTEAAVSRRIKLMLENDLIEKTTSPDDRRASVLVLKPKGKNLMKKLQKFFISNIELILKDFSQTDRKNTKKLLSIILSKVMQHSSRKNRF